MGAEISADRWWVAAAAALAVSSVLLGVIALGNGHTEWAIATGFAPAVLLLAGTLLVDRWRSGATAMIVVASLGASIWWWMVYPVALAVVVIVGGVRTGKLGLGSYKAHFAG